MPDEFKLDTQSLQQPEGGEDLENAEARAIDQTAAAVPNALMLPPKRAMPEVITLSDVICEAVAVVGARESNPMNLQVPKLAEVLPKLDGIELGADVLVRLGVRMGYLNAVAGDEVKSHPAMAEFLKIVEAFYSDTKLFEDLLKEVESGLAAKNDPDNDRAGLFGGFAFGIVAAWIYAWFRYKGVDFDYLGDVIKWTVEGLVGGSIVGGIVDGVRHKVYERKDERSFFYEMAVFVSRALRQAENLTENDPSRRREVLIEAAKIVAARMNTKLETIGVLELDRLALHSEDLPK